MYQELWDRIVTNIDRLSPFNASAALFLSPNKTRPRVAVGDVFTNPDFAATLRLLNEEGPQALYTGTLAPELIAAVAGE